MKKVIVVIAAILLLGVWGQAGATTNWYIDETATGDDGGTTPANAFPSAKTAVEKADYDTSGHDIWMRRTHTENMAADWAVGDDGAPALPIRWIGWPRASAAITSASWTNGSTTVDDVVGITIDAEQHMGRYITGPDSQRYLITLCPISGNADALIIDREYAGTTVTLTDGAATIHADEDYATRPQAGIDAGWDADAADLPVIDADNGAYQIAWSIDDYWSIRNIEFRDTTDSNGIAYFANSKTCEIVGCFFRTDQNAVMVKPFFTDLLIKRCIFVGSGSGSSQRAIYVGGPFSIVDSAIYGFGDNGIYPSNGDLVVFLSNVNIGVEVANGDDDIEFGSNTGIITGIDVKLGGTNGDINYVGMAIYKTKSTFENYGKVLGAHKAFHPFGTSTKQTVVAGSGDPYKRTVGASAVMDIAPSISAALWSQDLGYTLFTHTYTSDGSSKTYRYYAQADALTTSATELWLEAEYVSAYDDTTEYVMSTVRSDEALTQRSGADDWDEYLEVTVDPAVASTVRIFLKINKYDSDGHIYVDPMVQIN